MRRSSSDPYELDQNNLTSQLTYRRPLPCQEETITDELLVVARIRIARHPQHRQEGSIAALQSVSVLVARLVVMPSDADKRAVAAFRLHKPPVMPLRRRLRAVVEDQVLICRAEREWRPEFGRAVDRRDMAGFVAGGMEVIKLMDIDDEQRGVVVEDVKDLESVLAPTVPKVWNVVSASNLEAEPTALGHLCLLRDDLEREGDGHVAA